MAGNILTPEIRGESLTCTSRPAATAEPLEGLQIDYAILADRADFGMRFARGTVAPGATVPPHAGPNDYAMYVLSGEGYLTLHNSENAEVDRIAFAAGDLILFPPNANHGWVNSSKTEFTWFGVDISPPAKD